MKYCKKCLFPETKPDLSFNHDGVCSACIAAEEKEKGIDWIERERELEKICSHYRNGSDNPSYDCIIPVSGGKDSTFQALTMRDGYNMNPLCVCFETTYATPLGEQNLKNLQDQGFDVIHFRKNSEAYKSMVIEGFKTVGDEMWPNHIGIFTIPVMIAVKFNIPLIVWGENSQQEYGGPNLKSVQSRTLDRQWLEEFGGLLGYRISDMIGVNGITKKDLTPYWYPSDKEIKQVGVTGIFLGSYLKWDARKQLEYVKENGFKVSTSPLEGTYTNFENLDESLVSLHDYLKFVKYGFGRATDHVNIDIRNKRISREEGIKLLEMYEGKFPYYGVAKFQEYSGMSFEEISKIINSFTNPIIFATNEIGEFKRDMAGNLVPLFNYGS